jgi:hypothetical protein
MNSSHLDNDRERNIESCHLTNDKGGISLLRAIISHTRYLGAIVMEMIGREILRSESYHLRNNRERNTDIWELSLQKQ